MRYITFIIFMAVSGLQICWAQELTLEEAVAMGRTSSVQALQAKSSFVSSYWAWRSYKASRLPSLYLYGEVGSFDRSLRLLQNYENGEMIYVPNYNMQNSIGIMARQNITFTGGILTLYSNLTRIDQFGKVGNKTWYAQPVALSYEQPLFSYNQFKWDKLISPKEYEKSRRVYIEAMEAINIRVVDAFFDVMAAQMQYDRSVSTYKNASKLLVVARDRTAIGSITRDECLQIELRMLRDSIAVGENWVSLKKAQMGLGSLLGLEEPDNISVILQETLPDVVMDYDIVRSKARENASFSLDNEINVLNAESSVARAKANRGITMSLNARFGLSHSAADLKGTYNNMLDQEVVGLTFSIPIFDWGLGKGRVKKAEASAAVVKAQVEQAENDYNITLFTAVGQFNSQRSQCSISRRAGLISKERYEILIEKFKNGTATVTELNTAQSEYESAMQKYVVDISNFWKYYYTLRKLTLYDFLAGNDLDVAYDEMVK